MRLEAARATLAALLRLQLLLTNPLGIGCELHAAGGTDVECPGERTMIVDRGRRTTVEGLLVLVAQLRMHKPITLIHLLHLIVQH